MLKPEQIRELQRKLYQASVLLEKLEAFDEEYFCCDYHACMECELYAELRKATLEFKYD